MSDFEIPLTPVEGNIPIDTIDASRHEGKDSDEPAQQIEAWRKANLDTEPPPGYLEPPEDV